MAVDPSTYPDEEEVGSVYEIAINGVGYVLADTPDQPYRSQRGTMESARLATSATPFSEAVERYSFVGQSTFTGGQGQKFADRDSTDPTRYWKGYGVNPFEDEVLQTGQYIGASEGSDFGSTNPLICTIDADMNKHIILDDASGTMAEVGVAQFTVTGAGVFTDLCSDGDYWYACDGANIFRNNTGADPGSAWSTVDADIVEWAVDRLAAVYDDGSNIKVTTLSEAGVEEVTGGRFTYEQNVSIPSMCAGDGYLWWIVNRDGRSEIHYWQIGSADTYAANAVTMPKGREAVEIFFYLGQVFIKTVSTVASEFAEFIYQGIPAEGRLTISVAVEYTTRSSPASSRMMTGWGKYVAFAFTESLSVPIVIGAIDVSTGGWALIGRSGVAGTGPYSMTHRSNGVTFTALGNSSARQINLAEPASTGQDSEWYSSIYDFGSGLPKVWDSVKLVFTDDSSGGGNIEVSYTIDNGDTYTSLGAAASISGLSELEFDIGVEAQSLGILIEHTASAGSSFYMTLVQIKAHPVPPVDELLQIPINCGDEVTGLNRRKLKQTGGVALARTLQTLVGTRCKLQDVDWPTTATPTYWDVVGADYVGTQHFFNRHLNRLEAAGVCVVTLRRPTS